MFLGAYELLMHADLIDRPGLYASLASWLPTAAASGCTDLFSRLISPFGLGL
jgi:hypothetical protein